MVGIPMALGATLGSGGGAALGAGALGAGALGLTSLLSALGKEAVPGTGIPRALAFAPKFTFRRPGKFNLGVNPSGMMTNLMMMKLLAPKNSTVTPRAQTETRRGGGTGSLAPFPMDQNPFAEFGY